MSKGWPDPFTDRGDDFWNFDNMVNEYEYEQRRKAVKQQCLSEASDFYMPEFRETQDDRLSFTQADKVKIELLLLENSSKDECTDVVFKVSNTHAFPIEFFKINYNVCDRSGRILCDGMASEFNVIRPGGCAAVRDSIWPENEFRREDIMNPVSWRLRGIRSS